MAGQSITYDFIGRGADRLASDFRKTGDSAALAAKGARLCADALDKQNKAASASVGATLALAKADKLLADAEFELSGAADVAARKQRDQARAAEEAAAKTAAAGAGASAAAGGFGSMGGAMGAAIAAGVALSPIIATVGVGLGGLGLAALGVSKNSKLMGQELAPLKAEFATFTKSLQPEVLTLFGQGIQIAGHLMHDIQPVAAATGKALSGFLGTIDQEFQSRTWQNFFGFMAAQAAPDMKLLAQAVLPLLDALPRLLVDLQPVAVQMLQMAAAAGKIIDASITLNDRLKQVGATADHSGGFMGHLADAAKRAFAQMFPGVGAAQKLTGELNKLGGQSDKTGGKVQGMGGQAAAAAVKVLTLEQQVNALTAAENKALSPLLAYSNALITQTNDAATLNKALQVSHDKIGLKTAAERASFSAANTYIQDLLNTAQAAGKSHQGIDGVIASLRNELPRLQNARGGTAAYWREVQTLTNWLHRLQAIKLISETVKVYGNGQWTTPANRSPASGPGGGHALAAGGRITAGTGPTADDVLVRVSRGETVVSAAHSALLAPTFASLGVPGYASGGIIPSYTGRPGGLVPWGEHNRLATIAQITAAIARTMAQQFAAAAQTFTSTRVPNVGSGIARWAPLVRQALAMEHLSPYLVLRVLYQILTESGGNPNAINLTDINARRGDPSRGLLQTIGSTFRAYHWPGTSWNIYDPLANIAAALNYARHRYGPTLMSGNMGIGSGHGYDHGGYLPVGWSVAYNGTGRPEQVIPHGRTRGGDGATYVFNFPHYVGSHTDLVRALSDLKRQGRLPT